MVEKKNEVVLKVKVNPRCPKNSFEGIMEDGTIKIRLTSAPVEGKANQELIAFFAKELDCPKSNITIKSGQTSKIKLVSIRGMSEDQVARAIGIE